MAKREAVLEELRGILGELTRRAPAELDPAATFSELGLDSMASIELLARLEDRYDLVVPEEDAVHMTTLDAVVRYVARHAG